MQIAQANLSDNTDRVIILGLITADYIHYLSTHFAFEEIGWHMQGLCLLYFAVVRDEPYKVEPISTLRATYPLIISKHVRF
jgi:hypothetical protein